MATLHPTETERLAVLTMLAEGMRVDAELHGDTLAVLIGDGCVGLEGTFMRATFSLTKEGLEEMRRQHATRSA
jgi:hypothetical protein